MFERVERIFVSVSGGRSSMLMAKLLTDKFPDKAFAFVFSNTGMEDTKSMKASDSESCEAFLCQLDLFDPV